MGCKMITIEELKEGNERLCLSSLRVFNKCSYCSRLDLAFNQGVLTLKKYTQLLNKWKSLA